MTEKTETTTIARLDKAGVYWGVLTIAVADLTESQVKVPADCDLPPGKYRWNAADKRFDALPHQVIAPDQVSLEAVLYALAKHAREQGAGAPEIRDYCDQYERSVDNIKSVDGGAQ